MNFETRKTSFDGRQRMRRVRVNSIEAFIDCSSQFYFLAQESNQCFQFVQNLGDGLFRDGEIRRTALVRVIERCPLYKTTSYFDPRVITLCWGKSNCFFFNFTNIFLLIRIFISITYFSLIVLNLFPHIQIGWFKPPMLTIKSI